VRGGKELLVFTQHIL